MLKHLHLNATNVVYLRIIKYNKITKDHEKARDFKRSKKLL